MLPDAFRGLVDDAAVFPPATRRCPTSGPENDTRSGPSPESDLESFTWFFTAEYPQVVRLLTVVLHDRGAAEDVAQEAFIRLHRHWEKVSRYERPEAWVRRHLLTQKTLQRIGITKPIDKVEWALQASISPWSPSWRM